MGAVALGNLGELVGDDVFVGFGLRVLKGLLQFLQFGFIAAHLFQVFGFVGLLRGFHFFESFLLLGPVLGPNFSGAFEGKVLEHVRQAALAGGIVHIAGIDEGAVG